MRWKTVRLGQLVVAHYGRALPEASRDTDGPHTVFGSSGAVGKHSSRLIGYPTLVVGRKGSVGRVSHAPEGGWPIDTTYYLECIDQDQIDLRYLFWALSLSGIETRGDTTSIPGLSRTVLYRTPVPLPPLPEQCRIAAILDKADAIRRKRQESLKLLDELLRSTFLEMFGDPVRNERGWEMVKLGEVAEVERGKFTPRPRNDPRYYGGALPFIQTGDIARSEGTLEVWQQTLNEAGAAVSRNFPRGSIAVAIAANIGDTAIVDFDFFCPDSVVVVTPRAGVQGEYVEYCLRFFKPVLESSAPQTAQRNINLGVLRPLRLPVAPLTLQSKFRSAWHRHSRIRVALEKSADAAAEMLSSLSHAAFTGRL